MSSATAHGPSYIIHRAPARPPLSPDATHVVWQAAEVARIAHFRQESSHHHPTTEVRLLHDEESIHALFTVQDRYVRSVHEGAQSPVWKDSCVEWFVRPLGQAGYFNFEMNAGGSLLSTYIVDWARVPGGFKDYTPLAASLLDQVTVRSSLPRRIEPELAGPLAWSLYLRIPRGVLEAHTGPLGSWAGQRWTGNFYKCGDETSHPHWASWAPVRALNFHNPHDFGMLHLA